MVTWHAQAGHPRADRKLLLALRAVNSSPFLKKKSLCTRVLTSKATQRLLPVQLAVLWPATASTPSPSKQTAPANAVSLLPVGARFNYFWFERVQLFCSHRKLVAAIPPVERPWRGHPLQCSISWKEGNTKRVCHYYRNCLWTYTLVLAIIGPEPIEALVPVPTARGGRAL